MSLSLSVEIPVALSSSWPSLLELCHRSLLLYLNRSRLRADGYCSFFRGSLCRTILRGDVDDAAAPDRGACDEKGGLRRHMPVRRILSSQGMDLGKLGHIDRMGVVRLLHSHDMGLRERCRLDGVAVHGVDGGQRLRDRQTRDVCGVPVHALLDGKRLRL